VYEYCCIVKTSLVICRIIALSTPLPASLTYFRPPANICVETFFSLDSEREAAVGFGRRDFPANFLSRVARLFLVQKYQNEKNMPNDHKLYQKAINYARLP
jgi:hypothetical protein